MPVADGFGQIAAHFVRGPVAVVDSDVSGLGHKEDALFDQSKETLLERTVHFRQAAKRQKSKLPLSILSTFLT